MKSTRLIASLGLALCLGTVAASVAAAPLKGDPAKAAPMVEEKCAGCHGPDGNSPAPNFPSLAGQNANYLLQEMQAYKSLRRSNDMMTPPLEGLTDQDLINIALFFAKQKPTPGTVGNPDLLKLGGKLYLQGNPASGVPACDICHGGDGHGRSIFPRVAAQGVDYSIDQFNQYAHDDRKSGKKIMRSVAKRLTEAEIKALAEYMASLAP